MKNHGVGESIEIRPPKINRTRVADIDPRAVAVLNAHRSALAELPDAVWPVQIADALRGLIHQANLAREHGLPAIANDIRNELITRFRPGVLVGCPTPPAMAAAPGERKARLLLQVLRDRQADVLRFAHDLKVPPTSSRFRRGFPALRSRSAPRRLRGPARVE